MSLSIKVHVALQRVTLWNEDSLLRWYLVSTAKNGIGNLLHSEKTPLGKHEICEKIGEGMSWNTVFRHRKPTGERYTPYLKNTQPGRDWILTRILRLKGLEEGINQGGEVDTFARCIYFHGAPDESPMGIPASRGCIRMHHWDIVELFDTVSLGTPVEILP